MRSIHTQSRAKSYRGRQMHNEIYRWNTWNLLSGTYIQEIWRAQRAECCSWCRSCWTRRPSKCQQLVSFSRRMFDGHQRDSLWLPSAAMNQNFILFLNVLLSMSSYIRRLQILAQLGYKQQGPTVIAHKNNACIYLTQEHACTMRRNTLIIIT